MSDVYDSLIKYSPYFLFYYYLCLKFSLKTPSNCYIVEQLRRSLEIEVPYHKRCNDCNVLVTGKTSVSGWSLEIWKIRTRMQYFYFSLIKNWFSSYTLVVDMASWRWTRNHHQSNSEQFWNREFLYKGGEELLFQNPSKIVVYNEVSSKDYLDLKILSTVNTVFGI